jgi:hypothetical protein
MDGPEVAGHRERDEGSATAVGGVGDRPLLALGQPRDARILTAPDLLGVVVDVGAQQRLRVEGPAADAVAASRDVELRDPAQVLGRTSRTVSSPTRAAAGLDTVLVG